MKILLVGLGLLVALVACVAIIGAWLPKQHTAARSIVIRRPPQAVYETIRDFAAAPQWRNDVQQVEMLGPTRFRERGKHGTVTYDIVNDEPGRRVVTRIADTDLGYSGAWTYLIEPAPEGTRVTITEDGEVTNVVFRFLSRFVFGHAATLEEYLAALQRRLA
jgi:uncharacterized protein YndB with AHSA1/START domain